MEFIAKIKSFFFEMKEEIVLSLIIVFVGLSSFGLGKLSVTSDETKEIQVMSQSASVAEANYTLMATPGSQKANKESGSSVVASKNGSKYHYPWCGGAKQISAKNKISFATIEEARKAGYLPAANCKGLK